MHAKKRSCRFPFHLKFFSEVNEIFERKERRSKIKLKRNKKEIKVSVVLVDALARENEKNDLTRWIKDKINPAQ